MQSNFDSKLNELKDLILDKVCITTPVPSDNQSPT